jgi:hypothetical protein
MFGAIIDLTDPRTMFLVTPLVLLFSGMILVADLVGLRREPILAGATVTPDG